MYKMKLTKSKMESVMASGTISKLSPSERKQVFNYAFAQDTLSFEKVVQLDANPVESQGQTGTCWSFAASSFLESELIRMGKGTHNLSEIFIARQVYCIGKWS